MPEPKQAVILAPVANRTWEVLTTLRNDQQESDEVVVSFPRPTRIVAIYPSISLLNVTEGPYGAAQLDDILVSISLNEETRLTNAFDVVNRKVASTFVTLGAFRDTTGGARILDIELPGETNEVVVKFRWKTDVANVAALYQHAIIGLAFEANFETLRNLQPQIL